MTADDRVEVVGGVEEDACSRLLTRFFRGEQPEQPTPASGGMPAAADPSSGQETTGSDSRDGEPGARPSR